MQGVGPEVMNLGADHFLAHILGPVHPACRLADFGQGVCLRYRVYAAYCAKVFGGRYPSKEKAEKYSRFSDRQNAHVFPGDGKMV